MHVIITSLCDTMGGCTKELYPLLVAFMTVVYNLRPFSAILTHSFDMVEVLWLYSLSFRVI